MKKEIYLDVTLKCLFDCIHCSSVSTGDYDHLSIELLNKRIAKLLPIASEIEELVLTGGEPLLRKDLGIVIRSASRIHPEITLFTTGHGSEGIPKPAAWKAYKNNGLSKAVFSVHSTNQDVNDSFFEKPALKNTLRSIEYAGDSGLDVQVNCVLTKKNYRDLDETADLLINSYGIKKIRLLRFVSQGRGELRKDELYLEPYKCRNIISELKEKYGKGVHPEGFPSLYRCRSNENIGNGCQFAKGFLHISADGYVVPCPAVKRNEQTIIGNLDSFNDIRELLKSAGSVFAAVNPRDDYFGCRGQASWK